MKLPWFAARKRRRLGAMLAAAMFPALPIIPAINSPGPTIQFAAPIYKFGKAMAGDLVRHDFEFTNTGNATLVINGVYPSCGCTTPGDWTRRVEPGHTGHISLQFDSTRFVGPVTEVTTIANNDRAHYNVVLSFTGTVWQPVEVNPMTVILRPIMEAGTGDTSSSEIINNLPDPITIENPVSDNPAFEPELKTEVPGRKFRLSVHCGPVARSTMIHGNISMKTSSSRAAVVSVAVLAVPQSPLALSPTVISLPSGALTAATNTTVSLRNNGPNPLKLNEAKIDVPGAEVEIKELQPGREFALNLFFPAGFQLPADREATLTITTSNPQTPVLKVPLRPARAAAPAKPAPPNH